MATSMDLEAITVKEIIQKEKDIYHMIFFIYGIKHRKKETQIM